MGRSKKIRKHIAGRERQIELHKEKIAEEQAKPSPYWTLIRKWEKDIAIFQREIEELIARLPGKLSEEDDMPKIAATTKEGAVLNPTTDLLELALQELAEECAHALFLMSRLRRLPPGDERETLEGDLHASLSHLRMEATFALKEWDKLIDSLPDS